MRLAEALLKLLNTIISLLLGALLVIAGFFCVYAIWDAQQVYQQVDDLAVSLQAFRPGTGAQEETRPGLAELQQMNPDVCGWLKLEGTAIDYPVLQGRTNLVYLSTDAFGKYSLAGSIFLDSRNSREADDPYLLVYGHHMDDHRMFGDLELYLDRAFFDAQQGGAFLTPRRSFRVLPFLCMSAKETEQLFFDPELASLSLPALLDEAERRAVCLDKGLLEEMKAAAQDESREPPPVLAMATCAEGAAEDRTLLLAALRPFGEEGEARG